VGSTPTPSANGE